MPRSPIDSPGLGLVLAIALMAFGGLIRGWAATWGYISDEICWIFPGGVWENFITGETAVNPPAIRMVLAAITSDHWQAIQMGRAWSFAAGTAAIGLAFWLGRLVGGHRNVPGLLAAAHLMLLPLAIQQSGLFRSYATLQLVLLWHLIALIQVVERWQEPPPRAWRIHLVASAAALPQVHYVGVAILLFEGLTFALWLRSRRFLRYYVPAALLFLPLGLRIVTRTQEHLAAGPDWWRSLAELFKLAEQHPVLAALTLLCWPLWRRRQRTLLLATVASSAGLIAVASYHSARDDLGIVTTLHLAPLMAALPLAIPAARPVGRWARACGWAIIALLFAELLADRLPRLLLAPRPQDGPPLMARDLQAGRWPADRPTFLWPPSTVQPVYFYLTGQRRWAPCPADEHAGPTCFEHQGQIVGGLYTDEVPPSYVVVFAPESHEQRFGAQCQLARAQVLYWVWDCAAGWKEPSADGGRP